MDMKVGEAWLRERVNPNIGSDELARQLTGVGLTVDRLEAVAPAFTDVVVVNIDEVRPHPDADQLFLCSVHDGQWSHTVVCGAENVVAGAKAALAKVGAQLPGGISIEQRSIRGVTSAGMLCAADELGLSLESDTQDGILLLPADAPVGEDVRLYLQLDDQSLHLDLTPNRADCLSIEGLAREVAAINAMPAPVFECPPTPVTIKHRLAVTLTDPSACPKYLGRVIKGLDLTRPTPVWMREKLRRCNIRSISPVVDVTNYLLRELGQPMHAFDLKQLGERIEVRQARAAERLCLINGQTIDLDEHSLVIADDTGVLALAGVMGGQKSSIQMMPAEPVMDIFLECAYFNPLAIVGRARRYGLTTDAAQCYEHGVDFELQALAMERATQLLLDIAGGQAGPVTTAISKPHLPVRPEIQLRTSQIYRLLGIRLSTKQAVALLARLGFQVQPAPAGAADGCLVRVPSYRFDVDCEATLVSEVGRLHGYDKIPSVLPTFSAELQVKTATDTTDTLVRLGYQEIITYSFISQEFHDRLTPKAKPVCLQNPAIADRPVMRASLLPGLLSTLTYNLNRQQQRLRLFEAGCVFEFDAGAENGIRQRDRLAALITGSRQPEGWFSQDESVDFHDLKGDLEVLLGTQAAASVVWSPSLQPALHPTQSTELVIGNQAVGVLGRLHPEIESWLGVRHPVYVFEIEKTLPIRHNKPGPVAVAVFPSTRRDISIVVERGLPADEIIRVARQAAGPLLTQLVLFDLYQGSNIPSDRKSVALGFTFQDPGRNLLESEIDMVVQGILKMLHERCAARLRD